MFVKPGGKKHVSAVVWLSRDDKHFKGKTNLSINSFVLFLRIGSVTIASYT